VVSMLPMKTMLTKEKYCSTEKCFDYPIGFFKYISIQTLEPMVLISNPKDCYMADTAMPGVRLLQHPCSGLQLMVSSECRHLKTIHRIAVWWHAPVFRLRSKHHVC
jgi:hypothetical protein